jgi:glycosyltransferase involved in cell wall biosynthesis
MRKLTVLSVAFPFAIVSTDPIGGAEQILARIDRTLIEAGHHSIVLAAEGSESAGDLITLPRISGEIRQAEWNRAHASVRAAIAGAVRTQNVDLVHLHGVDFPNYLPTSNIRVLATLHLPLSYYPPDVLDPARPRTWLNTVSTAQTREIRSHSSIVAMIENGVAAPHGPTPAKESFALAMGRICPEKGFHLALDAARAANLPLKLAGAVGEFPEHRAYFEREIVPRLDADRQWIGPVAGSMKWRLLSAARCVLVPSLVAETASLVAREALAAGTPVIAFPSGALSETIEDGYNGFLVDNLDRMVEALSRTEEIASSACRLTAETKYSAARMSQQYLELYDRLMELD